MRALFASLLVLILFGSSLAAAPPYPNAYAFTREVLPSGAWDVDHPDRKTILGEQIHLADEVAAALPGLAFRVRMVGDDLEVFFAVALSSGQQSTLAAVVADHKANALL